MSAYQNDIKAVAALKEAAGSSWSAINPESVARMRAQNRFKTGLEIAQYTADIMRKDMAEYDADSSKYTQSLGCWHGFIGQQKLIAIKKHLGTTNKRYLYLSGWMVAALRSDFGPLPDQSMIEKTAVSDLIEELYTFLRQANIPELDLLFTLWTPLALPATTPRPLRSRTRSTTTKLTSYRSLPTSTLVSVTRKPPTCWPSA